MTKVRSRLRALALGVAVVALAPAAHAEEVLFDEAPNGILELAGQRRLRFEGIRGTVFVRAGKEGELRYASATRTSLRAEQPIGLWLRGSTMFFRPVEGAEDVEIILEVALSDGVDVEIVQQGGKVQVASVGGAVRVDAEGTSVDVRGATGTVGVDLQGGSLRLENLKEFATITAASLESVQLTRLQGGSSLTLRESEARLDTMGGGLQLDLERVQLDLSTLQGELSGRARGGSLTLEGLRAGARLDLEEARLDVSNARGDIEVNTDSEVQFRQLAGGLKVESFGGAVRGVGNTGGVDIRTHDNEVVLESIGGPSKVSGDALRVSVKDVQGDLTIETSGSAVEVEKVAGALHVSNEFGDVSVSDISGPARLTNRNGNLVATALQASLELAAESPEVRVAWSVLGNDRDSVVENRGGDLFVTFPNGARGRVEAEGDSIETDIEEFSLADDGRSGAVLLERAESPSVQLKASGRLVLVQGQ